MYPGMMPSNSLERRAVIDNVHVHLRAIACLVLASSFSAVASDSAIVGKWETHARAFPGMAPVSITDEHISIESCVNASYSAVSDETISKHWLWTGRVRRLTLKLTGPGCDDPNMPFDYLRLDIPLEDNPENQLLIGFCVERRGEELWFGCSGIFHRLTKM